MAIKESPSHFVFVGPAQYLDRLLFALRESEIIAGSLESAN